MTKKNILLTITTILIIAILFVGAYVVKIKIIDKKQNTKEPVEEETNKTLEDETFYTVTETAYKLMNKMLIEKVGSCSANSSKFYYYNLDSITVDQMSDGMKIYLGIMQYAEDKKFATSETVTLTRAEVAAGIQKVFGKGITYKDASFGSKACIGNYDAFKYDATTGTYTITPEKCECDASKGEVVYQLVSEKDTDKTIEVTLKMLVSATTYDADTKQLSTKLYLTTDLTKDPLAEVSTYKFSDYIESLRSYKFTFTKNGEDYFFTKVELVK